jgi:ATP-dependent helicase/nuclease subunit A
MSRLAIPEPLRERQARASNPATSAFVSANAGSGKTHVLTQRVLRLLLARTPPGQILCLAYTKAAAANMAERIFGELARWTTFDDEALAQAIVDSGAGKPTPEDLVFARQLFARTIESPGGLRIQTIHAFAERLLRLFPFEANVPARFKVVDASETKLLLVEARNAALAALKAVEASAKALDRVALDAGAMGFDAILNEASRRVEAFGADADMDAYVAALSARLGIEPDATAARVEAEMLGGDQGRERREKWAKGLDQGSSNDRQIAEKLRAAGHDGVRGAAVAALCDAFFTGKNQKPGEGDPRGALMTKPLRKALPQLDDELRREQERLIPLRERLRAALTLERSAALFVVATAIISTYARMKAERGALDFDDQIARALALLTRSSAAWVLRKLDYGLDHLLLDEAQDASASQWGILEALSAEFFAGASARLLNRTVFAVGDEKQSIFRFQGAAPEMFEAMKRAFARRHRDAGLPFVEVPLNYSLRSSQTILEAVDKTFGSEAARLFAAVNGEQPPAHLAIRDLKGVVELWPPIAPEPAQPAADWRLPLDHVSSDAPPAILARRIAEAIGSWVRPGSPERVVDRGTGEARPIRESDVMILVRSRNALFETTVRALRAAGLKAAGADRLKLTDHIAVMDLVAAGRTALLPDDDLTLAEALKSPLVGLDDDQLMMIAVGREGSLMRALETSNEGFARTAAQRLALWRARAKALSPFAFYALLLGEDGGRKALLGRLGPEAADPIDEFLSLALKHEQMEAPSLMTFLAEVESTEAEIKRDMEAETEGVRVLTVHASKGLEAPIVFLPDSCGPPYYPQHDPKLIGLNRANADDRPLCAWAQSATRDPIAVAAARTEARTSATSEHRRLLYVAMTRAAERLIVAGCDPATGRPKECWYNLVCAGLKPDLVDATAPFAGGGAILRYGEGLRAENGAESPQIRPPKTLPVWLFGKAAPETVAHPLSPSRLGRAGEGDRERILEGRLAHALIEILASLAPQARETAASAYLDLWGRGLAEPARAALAAKVLAAIGAPELEPLFGPGSRGEVPLMGLLPRRGRPDLPFSGRLDRVLATSDGVSIVDFKLGAKPDRPAAAHVAQLALYRAALRPLCPGLPIRAALVYLDGPTTAPIGDEELDAACEALATAP